MKRINLIAGFVFVLVIIYGCQSGPSEVITQEPLKVMGSNTEETMPEAEEMVDTDGEEEPTTTNTYIDVSPAEAKELIDSNPDLVIIDVSPRYDQGHLPGSINYYVGDGSLDSAIPSLDKSATYLVYCHVDSAAILGAQKLIDAGISNVYRLEGNYNGWVDAGYDIEK